MTILKRLTPNGELLIPGEFDEYTPIIPGSINFRTHPGGSTAKLNITTTSDMNFGTGDFTVEFWLCLNYSDVGDIYSGGQITPYRQFTIFKNNNFNLFFYYSTSEQRFYCYYQTLAGTTSWIVIPKPGIFSNASEEWHHYSLNRKDSYIELYYDGQKVLTTDTDSRPGIAGQNNENLTLSGSILQIGDYAYNGTLPSPYQSYSNTQYGGIPGKITGIKWCKESLHTDNFVPSTSYPSTSSNTSLFLAPTGNIQNQSNNLLVDISGTNKTISQSNGTYSYPPEYSSSTPYSIPGIKVSQDTFYAYGFDEITINPISAGLAMREKSGTVMVSGEFDEMSLIGSDIINSSITKNSDFAYVDGQLYRVETFTSNATITFSENTTVDFLLVGGGQAGANGYAAGVYTTNYYKGNSGRPGEVVEQYSYAVTTDQIYSIEVGNYGTLLSSGDPISLAAKPSKIKFYNGTPIATANAGQIFVDSAKTVKFIGGVSSNSEPGTLVTVAWSSEEYMTDYASDSPGTLSYMTGKPVYYSSHYTTNPTRFIRATGRTATTYGGGGEGGVSNPGFFPSSMGGYGGQGVVIIRYRV